MTPLTIAEFQIRSGVSRETLERLEAYLALLIRWQKAINLVSKATLGDPWRRHMLDSAQLLPHLPRRPCRVVDLGSGAGFPGLVLSILGAGEIHLIESDSRKCAFLREAIRITQAVAILHEGRIETTPKILADVATARALAPLGELLAYSERHLAPGGVCLFLKGRGVEEELTRARKEWKMRIERFPNGAEPGGWILRIGDIVRV